MAVRRFDYGALERPQRMPNGWLKMDAYLSRVGVFRYRTPEGGERKELRPPEEVFSEETLDSFSMVPVTNLHPPEMLDAENTKEYAVGWAGERIRPDGDFVRGAILVTTKDAISDVEAGRQELSCGYMCDIEETSGVYEGQEYDCIQRNIRGNHVALVDQGRAGHMVRVRLDALDAFQVGDSPTQPRENAMKKIRIDGVECEVSEQAAQLLEKERERAQAKLDAAEDAAKKAEEKAAKAEARADVAEEELKKEKQARQDAVKARVALEVEARRHLGEDARLDGLSDKELKLKVLEKLSPDFKADGKGDAYIEARYDIAIEAARKENPALDTARILASGGLQNPREDASPGDPAAAKKRMEERNRNAWKQDQKAN